MKKLTLIGALGLALFCTAALADSSSALGGQLSKSAAIRAQAEANMKKIIAQAKAEEAVRQQAQLQAAQGQLAATGGSTNNPMKASDLKSQAFSNVVHRLMPLSAKEIHTLRAMFAKSKQAAAASPGVPPKPTSDTVAVNLSPGATPPVIRLASGFITSLVFVDSTGAPWPIQAYDLGDPGSFNIQWHKKSNTLLVQAISSYKSGNLAVMLKGLDTPIMLTLIPGQRVVDYRVDLRVPGLGPHPYNLGNANLPGSANPVLLNVLDGIGPEGSKQLSVIGGQAQLWVKGNKYYLRTPMTLLSPSWISKMNSADGTHAYELPEAPFLLVSWHGQIVHLAIKGAA